MSDKIRVNNRNAFDIGLRLMDGIREINIKPNSFIMLDEDEIYYQHSISNLFLTGKLTVDNENINTNLGFVEKNPNTITESEIEAILKDNSKGNMAKMMKALEVITEPFAKDKVYNISTKLAGELSGTKLQYLSEFCGREIEIKKPENETK